MRVRWIAAAWFVALALGASGPSAKPATAAAAEPIKIGNIGTYSGAHAATNGGVRPGLEVWQQSVNDSGGINGRPVEIIFKDDAGDPTTALTAVTELIEDDGVIVILDPVSVTSSWQTYATERGVPTITANGLFGSGLAFSAGTTAGSFAPAFPNAAALTGVTSYAMIYCAEVPACKDAVAPQQQSAEALGMEFSSYAASGSDPNYSALCLSLKQDEVEAVMLGSFTAVDVRIAEDCAAQGYNPRWIISGASLDASVEASGALNGVIAVLIDFPWFQNDTPATEDFHAALDQYAPEIFDDPLNYNANLSGAWAAGKVFEKAAAAMGDTISSAAFLDGLFTIQDDDFEGLTPPLSFANPQPEVECFFAIQLNDGDFGLVDGHDEYLVC